MVFPKEPIVDEIDAAGYDAQAMGNREFHYVFGVVRARAARMRHPLLCANLVDVRGRTLPFAPERTFLHEDGERTWTVRVFSTVRLPSCHRALTS